MSPIIDIQRSLAEVGRIRMGHQVPLKGKEGTRPATLEHWRITTPDRHRADEIARLYGGEVKAWEEREGFWEIFTETDVLPIALVPGHSVTQWYELWSGGGCQRRCDGVTEQLTDDACLCDPDARECKPHTRLNVMLPEVRGFGHFRLDTQGYYAARELGGVVDLFGKMAAAGEIVNARLRIDQRKEIKDGETKRYSVPVIDVDVSLNELLSDGRYVPLDASVARGVSLEEGLRVIEQSSGATPRGAAAVSLGPVTPPPDVAQPMTPSAGDEGQTGGVVASAPAATSPKVISAAQVKRLWTMIRKSGASEERVREIVVEITGQESTKEIPKDLYDAVYATIQAEPKEEA